jgi:flavin-binding protein dodecin
VERCGCERRRPVEVVRHTARVDEGRITDYEVELKIFFEYEGT